VASVIFDAIHDNVATKADVWASEAAPKADIVAVNTRIDLSSTGCRPWWWASARCSRHCTTGRHTDENRQTGAPPTMPQPVLNARALKCTIVLDPSEVAQIVAPDGKPRTVIAIRLPDRRVSADLNAKSVRKAVAAISEYGPDGVAVIIQGKLVSDAITEAGIVAQPKVRPQTAAVAA
jgi:hypothetical protein